MTQKPIHATKPKLRSRSFSSQKTESKIAVNILNKMAGLGMPCSKKFA
jgi:hypothetical protein